ncbi:MAG: HAMP domain-containing sensor histidine kinase [Marinilabiliales bacterium]
MALAIGLMSLWYTNVLTKKLAEEERKKVKIYAEALKQLAQTDPNQNFDLSLALEIVSSNKTIPLILVDDKGNILSVSNIDSTKSKDREYLLEQLEKMKEKNEPIVVNLTTENTQGLEKDIVQYIYYSDSIILKSLSNFPFIQLTVFFLFILIAYYAFSSSRKAEQNQVWVGMSKETAHQLGTPISSILAWVELLKMKDVDKEIIEEIEKDMSRLETITDRFSKIGSTPKLQKENLSKVLYHSINYIKSRTSDKIKFNLHFKDDEDIVVPLNASLFEWVVENICKNAIDAMNGEGQIDIYLTDITQIVYIDFKDTGKGIPKAKYKTIFQPGYTTKERGWGLGLSLTKRIIESYHAGKIFVKSSEIKKGTTIRIALKK